MNVKHTNQNCAFTNDQRLFYEKNGFIVIRNNIDPVLIDKLCRRFIDICEGLTDDYNVHIVKDPVLRKKGASGQYAVNKIQDCYYDDVLWEYASNKAIVDVVEQIIGPNITVISSMLINKPPNSDPDISKHPLHQDLHYSPCRPAGKMVASWTAMERADEKNGCLYVIPGSHKGPLHNHDYPERGRLALYHGVQGMDQLPKFHVVMEKGDTLFFHPLLLHGSGPNLTKGFRKAISCHYSDSNCDLIDVTGTIQEKIAKEVEETIEKKTGERVSFMNISKIRSRLVRGTPGKLQQLECHL